jgi:hypothetical protein
MILHSPLGCAAHHFAAFWTRAGATCRLFFHRKVIRSSILNFAFTVGKQLLATITPGLVTTTDLAVAFCAEATIIVPRIRSE